MNMKLSQYKDNDRVAVSYGEFDNCIAHVYQNHQNQTLIIALEVQLSESNAFEGFIDWENETFSKILPKRYLPVPHDDTSIKIKRINYTDLVQVSDCILGNVAMRPKHLKTKGYRVCDSYFGKQYFTEEQDAYEYVIQRHIHNGWFFSKKENKLKLTKGLEGSALKKPTPKGSKVVSAFGEVCTLIEWYPFYGRWGCNYIDSAGCKREGYLSDFVMYDDKHQLC